MTRLRHWEVNNVINVIFLTEDYIITAKTSSSDPRWWYSALHEIDCSEMKKNTFSHLANTLIGTLKPMPLVPAACDNNHRQCYIKSITIKVCFVWLCLVTFGIYCLYSVIGIPLGYMIFLRQTSLPYEEITVKKEKQDKFRFEWSVTLFNIASKKRASTVVVTNSAP